MAIFKFTELADSDVKDIADYTFHKWGKHQVDKYIIGLEEQCQLLSDNPSIGADTSNLKTGMRSFPYGSHVLYYCHRPHGITFIRMLHKSMSPKKHFHDRAD